LTAKDAKGNRLPYTPKFTGSATVNYEVPLAASSLVFVGTLLHNSGYFPEVDNFLKQRSFQMVNTSLSWRTADSRLSLTAWMRNLTNEAVAQTLVASSLVAPIQLMPPRTYGLSLGTSF